MRTERRRMSETVSIALAAYRGERFLADQLRSLAEQTCPVSEVVITDDSPDDATEEAAATCGKRFHLKIRYCRNPERLGAARNFEKAISRCRGDLIFLCDQDDFWLPGKVEHMVRCFREHPEVSGVFCDSRLCDENLCETDRTLWDLRGFTPERQARFAGENQLDELLKRVRMSAHNIAFRAAMRDRLLPFPEMPGLFADSWLALRLAAAGGRWYALPEVLTCYRLHADNLSGPAETGLAGQMRAARRALAAGHLRGRRLIAEALLRDLGGAGEGNRVLLEQYCAFVRAREELPRGAARRFWNVLKLAGRGAYRRFDNGWKSVMVDLLLR